MPEARANAGAGAAPSCAHFNSILTTKMNFVPKFILSFIFLGRISDFLVPDRKSLFCQLVPGVRPIDKVDAQESTNLEVDLYLQHL